MLLVTDAMRAKCLGDGEYTLGRQAVKVTDGKATLTDGTLAGSTLSMNQAFKKVINETGCNLLDAVKMTSENPATILKIFDKKGSLKQGKDADITILNEEFNVEMSIVQGSPIASHSFTITTTIAL
jgi:N-acetylglucosamine-6-phosphate deacetylase